MNKAYLLIAGAMLLAPAANAQIADGSFEGKGAAGATGGALTSYCYDGVNVGGASNGACNDTTKWSGSGLVHTGNGDWGGTLAADGDYFAFVQGGQQLSQTFKAGKSGLYTLSWMDANRSNFGGDQTYAVDITGVGSLGSFTTNYTNWTGQSSSPFSLVKGNNYTLTFAGQSGAVDNTSFVDKLALTRVTQGAVPEPATWALMLGGFGLAGGMLRRRAGKSALRTA